MADLVGFPTPGRLGAPPNVAIPPVRQWKTATSPRMLCSLPAPAGSEVETGRSRHVVVRIGLECATREHGRERATHMRRRRGPTRDQVVVGKSDTGQ